jgi:hypothetical protein
MHYCQRVLTVMRLTALLLAQWRIYRVRI